MWRMLFKRVGWLVSFGFLWIPFGCFAFTVSPSVIDVPFTSEEPVVQVISVTNTTAIVQTYEARIQEVFFAEDGSIASFADVDSRVGVSVDESHLQLEPGVEGAFAVTFSHPEAVASSQVFGLLITEYGGDVQQISGGFVALLFPEKVVTDELLSFRIDLFTVVQEHDDIRVVAQFANTGDVLVRPSSIIVVTNQFDREIERFVFADHEGRLPVGTARVFSENLPFDSFGVFHLGGEVTFTLLSLAEGGGEVQRASAVLATRPGIGIFYIAGILSVLLLVGFVFLVKRRGILRA